MVRTLFSIVLLNMISCSANRFPFDSNGLTYKDKFVYAFNIGQIKMDGYFFQVYKEKTLFVEYFFENGYYCRFAQDYNKNFTCPEIDSPQRQIPYFWGVYVIDTDTIKIQRISGDGRGRYGKFMVEELWAKIENEGNMIRYFRKKDIDGKISVIDEVYKFHPCTNKPASTNILMQEKKN